MKTGILYYLVSVLAVGIHAKETILMCELCPDGIADGRGDVVVPEYYFMTCLQVIEEIPSMESVSKEDLFRHMGGEESIFPLSCNFYYFEIKAYCCPEMLPVESSVSIVNYCTSSGGNKGTVVAVAVAVTVVIVLSALGT